MALIRDWHFDDDGGARPDDDKASSSSIWTAIRSDLDSLPDQQVLDFLMQYFVNELNWMKQIVYPPSFLKTYRIWCAKDRYSFPTQDVEFSILILRICTYSIQFLPSPSYPADAICGFSISDICNTCVRIADSLSKACVTLDWKGSLVRVQHILFSALRVACEGRTDKFWEGIASASEAAQKAGIHLNAPDPGDETPQALEKEIRRRTFCGLFILDSHLSRQLDRLPFFPDDLVAEALPRLNLAPAIGELGTDTNAPEIFTERLMQVQLGRFWRSFGPRRNTDYDPAQGEQRYEKFCAEYCSDLPPAFTLVLDTKWDKQLPKLAMQRQLLHICIFDSVCWNFRTLLFLKPKHINSLPLCKQVLLRSQKKRIALAALKELEAVSALHSMFGSSHTRFSAIIFNSFEAGILLLCLCLHSDFPFDQGEDVDLLGLKVNKLTRAKAMQATEKALGRLQMLAEVSDMAASGAQVMKKLFLKATKAANDTSSELHATPSWLGTFSDLVGHEDDLEFCDWNISDIMTI